MQKNLIVDHAYHPLHLRGELATTLLLQFGQYTSLMVIVGTLVKEKPSGKFFSVTRGIIK